MEKEKCEFCEIEFDLDNMVMDLEDGFWICPKCDNESRSQYEESFLKFKSKFLVKYLRYHYNADIEGCELPIWFAKPVHESVLRLNKLLTKKIY